ncbi:exportin-5 [Bacillus rossius redtenbacheri]|uniref:exportin-5 n=1 Tax=Bacillus rossius redtenbacheri TaxID=93214 RepID=UPI002FDD5A81
MEVSPEVVRVAAELARAVELTMSPAAVQQQRAEAYAACERFKETSPLCAQCGLFLAQQTDAPHVVQHFGLQLLEHTIKYRWNQLSFPEKLFIKENTMQLLNKGMPPHLQDVSHIKNALSRVVVEMVKREWPQQWSELIPELSQACTLGETQTEMVLLIFLRLVEDVAVLQTLEATQRRREIYQALTANMTSILSFFLVIMEEHYSKYKIMTSQLSSKEASAHARVLQVGLLTLTGFVEWVSISALTANNNHLLRVLCILLEDTSFQIMAADCLVQIVNRKGSKEDRKPLLVLFNEDLIKSIFQSAGNPGKSKEEHYMFLKKLTQVLTGVGMQLCSLWSKEDGPAGCPSSFSTYLEAILNVTCHPSLTLAHYANSVWMCFFKHDNISKDPVFFSFVPRWVESTIPKIVKSDYPMTRYSGSPEAAFYACMDHDSDAEYATFFHRCRLEFCEALKAATLVAPLVTYHFVEKWLRVRLEKSLKEPPTKCTLQSPVFLEWEGLSQALECVLSRILMCAERPGLESGIALLELCLQYEPACPLLLSVLLSCISALFVFLSMAPPDGCTALLRRVLAKIFRALVFAEPGQTHNARSIAVKNVRRHAASLTVKVGVKYPLILLPLFDEIHATVQNIASDPAQLSKMERVSLQEALIIINNHFSDYARQTRFIGEVIGSVAERWIILGDAAFKSPKEFMSFVGLDKPPVEASSEDMSGHNRSQIVLCVNLLMAVVKRCSWPEDPDRAARGGFVVAKTESGNPVCRNPAAPHVVPLLPHLLSLLRVFNALWTPEAMALLSEGYKSAHNMLQVEKNNYLGIVSPTSSDPLDVMKPKTQTPLECMQNFLSTIYDYSYHVIGNVGHSFGRDFYSLQGLAPSLVATVFSNLEFVPDHRLRPIIKTFLKPFVNSCPPAFYEPVILPIFACFCPYMFTRLSTKWQYITQLYDSGSIDDDQADTQEVLEDMLNRTLTREYLSLLKLALVGGSSESSSYDTMDQDAESAEPPRSNSSLQAVVISELGGLLLRHEATCQSIVLCILRALWWGDTLASTRATPLAGPVVRLLAGDGSLTPDAAAHVMTSVLHALQLHGQHEDSLGVLVALGAQLYETLRPRFPSVLQVMNQIPNINPQDLQKFDEKVLSSTPKGTNKVDKSKKDIFKKVTNHLIGRSMAQLFRKEVRIKDLPRLELPKREIKKVSLDEKNGEDIGLSALFTNSVARGD